MWLRSSSHVGIPSFHGRTSFLVQYVSSCFSSSVLPSTEQQRFFARLARPISEQGSPTAPPKQLSRGRRTSDKIGSVEEKKSSSTRSKSIMDRDFSKKNEKVRRKQQKKEDPPPPPPKQLSIEQDSFKRYYKLRVVAPDEVGMRLDHFIAKHYPVPNSKIHRMLREKEIFIGVENREKKLGSYRLQLNDHVHIFRPAGIDEKIEKRKPETTSQGMKVTERDIEWIKSLIIFQDEYFLAINKPSGISVQGGTKTKFHIAGLLPHLQFTAEEVPRLVHRLDQDTSGILLLARTKRATQAATRLLKHREVMKVYWAVVVGTPEIASGRIEAPFTTYVSPERGELSTTKIPEDKEDVEKKMAITEFETIASCSSVASFIELVPMTGRKHQLRVHCAEVLKSPILGDYKYGKGVPDSFKDLVKGRNLHLHARGVSFVHPFKPDEKVRIVAPLPADLEVNWESLGFPTTTRRTTLSPESTPKTKQTMKTKK